MNRKLKINKDKCKLCFCCFDACGANNAIVIRNTKNGGIYINNKNCAYPACVDCLDACPNGAIYEERET